MDFRISNVFDHIFREKLSGASILQWSRSFDDICVCDETKIERMDICSDEFSRAAVARACARVSRIPSKNILQTK